jgi:hypothetical protein
MAACCAATGGLKEWMQQQQQQQQQQVNGIRSKGTYRSGSNLCWIRAAVAGTARVKPKQRVANQQPTQLVHLWQLLQVLQCW